MMRRYRDILMASMGVLVASSMNAFGAEAAKSVAPGNAVVAASAENVDVKVDSLPDYSENVAVPSRALVLYGGQNGLNEQVYTVLYDSSEDVTFHDPVPPRFLLIDREGRTVFGIGGYVEGVAAYDFDGAIDDAGFKVNQINVPTNPAFRNQLSATVDHSNIFMMLVSKTRFGLLSVYAQAAFSNSNRNFTMKHAVVRLHNVLAGLTRTTFLDPLASVPTIDYTGPVGAVQQRNVQLRYTWHADDHFSFAAAAEMPCATYTVDPSCEALKQRVPDIPFYAQYRWDGGKSHVRVSGLIRTLSYRDLVSGENRFRSGWAAKLSGAIKITDLASFYYSTIYGRGYGQYVHGTTNCGFDLIYGAGGTMIAPHQFDLTLGLRVNISPKVFASGTYSLDRLYNQGHLGPNTYRRGTYTSVNVFYTPMTDLQFGLEYLHGTRTNADRVSGSANRIQAMIRYDF